MQDDFGRHFGAWLLICGTLLVFLALFFIGSAEMFEGGTVKVVVYGFVGIFVISFICSLLDYFAVPTIIRYFKSRRSNR